MINLPSLRQMIVMGSKVIEKVFDELGCINPMYDLITENGDKEVWPAPPTDDKDLAVRIVRETMRKRKVIQYLFIDEAWILHTHDETDIEFARTIGLQHHTDRREVIMFSAENLEGEMLTAKRYILRSDIPGAKASLSPLEIDDMTDVISSGRMVGLLR